MTANLQSGKIDPSMTKKITPQTPLANQIRHQFLQFYADRGHAIIPSAPLVPENDPSTLFTSSGMQPLVPNLLGEPHPEGTRLTDSQKSFRSNDIEEVGDARHTTFFEMLGNWSLGDYFKAEQLPWVWEFLTEVVGLNPHRLKVTVFAGNKDLKIDQDQESIAIWKKIYQKAGIDAQVGSEIFCYDEKKNWWSRSGEPANMPAGEPGGPDSEIFFDFGPQALVHEHSAWCDEPCHVNCDCGRYIEIGNSVFMQFQKLADGNFAELKQKNVDFGGGLERITMAAEDQSDLFLTSTFTGLRQAIEKLAQLQYVTATDSQKRAFRIIMDHVRAAVMLMADGVRVSNKEQGYVLRRLIRRAIRMARELGITQIGYLGQLADEVISFYADVYPEVATNSAEIKLAFLDEEKRFGKTIEKGLHEISKMSDMTGEAAFKLYESFGFPFELTQEIALERGWQVSEAEFQAAAEKHRQISRDLSGAKFKGGLQDSQEETVRYHTAAHLLQAALRKFFGENVIQKGSNITAERARFDFSLEKPLTLDDQKQIEKQVNDWIVSQYEVKCETLPKKEAFDSGAVHAFNDRYPDEVTVYTVGDQGKNWISKEICMGPHVKNLGELRPIKITKEKGAGQGIRRIYLEFLD